MGIVNKANFTKTIQYLKKNGISETYYAAIERIKSRRGEAYCYEPANEKTLKKQAEIALNCDLREWLSSKREIPCGKSNTAPKITVVIPAYETPRPFLQEAVESVMEQSYPAWELIIADASKSDSVFEYVSNLSNTVICDDSAFDRQNDAFLSGRIKYTGLKQNLGISDNTNEAIKYACGDYIALLDHDDIYTPDALFEIACAIIKSGDGCADGNPAVVYSDEDKTDSQTSEFYDPHRKFDFNYDLLLTNNYICHLVCIRRDIFSETGLRREYDGAQDFDLMLQIAEKLIKEQKDLKQNFIHVPKVLYHWRCHEASTALNTSSKMYAYEAGLKAVQKHVDNLYNKPNASGKRGKAMVVRHSKHLGFYKISCDIAGKTKISSKENKIKPDDYTWIFELRPDIGAVVGRHYDKFGKMLPIIRDERGNVLYGGLNKHFSGEMNRFDSAQDVAVADIRYITVNPKLVDRYVEILGEADNYKRSKEKNSELWFAVSKKFADALHNDGLKILYLPED